MHRQNRIPLLIRHFMNHAIPRITRIINNNVDLAISECCGFLDQDGEVRRVRDVSWDGDRAVGRSVVDIFGDLLGLGGVNVADDDFGAFIGEEAGAFGADALARACNLG